MSKLFYFIIVACLRGWLPGVAHCGKATMTSQLCASCEQSLELNAVPCIPRCHGWVPQGYGSGFVWSVYSNGTMVPVGPGVGRLMMAYSPPGNLALSVTSGIPTTSANGILVTITGQDMYDNCSVVTVTVGAWVWTPVSCNFTTLLVRSTAGAGGNLSAVVTVGGNSNAAVGLVSYLPPVINVLLADPLATAGDCCWAVAVVKWVPDACWLLQQGT